MSLPNLIGGILLSVACIPIAYVVVGILHLIYHAIQEKLHYGFESCWFCNWY